MRGQDGRRNHFRKKTGGAAICQRRFREHFIRDDSDYARHFDTIHYNPVKPEHLSIKNSPAGQQESQFLTLNEMDKRYIKTVFRQTGYCKKQTAKILDIGLNTLKRKLTEISCYSQDDRWVSILDTFNSKFFQYLLKNLFKGCPFWIPFLI